MKRGRPKKYNTEEDLLEKKKKWAQYQREWRDKDRKKYNEWRRANYRANPRYYELKNKRQKGEKYKKQKNKQRKERRESDIQFKILEYSRARISSALRKHLNKKKVRTIGLIGTSFDNLIKHLEKQFKPGMSWSNYGEWHIDHIKPCSAFDLSKKDEQLKAFNYKNLQPLWAIENLKKSNKYKDED